MQNPKVVIIGAGLSGLLIAYLLRNKEIEVQIFEARDRMGGRIYTLRPEGQAHVEMGATWLGNQHRRLLKLLDELDLSVTEQYMGNKGYYEPMSVSPPQLVDLPLSQEASYRIEGGTDRLIHSVADYLAPQSIHLNTVVQEIRKREDGIEVKCQEKTVQADYVISTLPPRLFADHIQCIPALPESLLDIASQTHTWMAESIKVALTFGNPFWKDPESSGTLFSNVGPVNEMYDHSGSEGYALKGFMNNAYHSSSADERRELIVKQLQRYYGDKVKEFEGYYDLPWRKEPFTYSGYEQPVVPHQHNGHALFQQSYMGNRLLLAGAETATAHPGYMEGAVESAERVVRQLSEVVS